MSDGAHHLNLWGLQRVRLSCKKCGRRGDYSREALAAKFGPDASMVAIRAGLSADCKRRIESTFADQCAIIYTDWQEEEFARAKG